MGLSDGFSVQLVTFARVIKKMNALEAAEAEIVSDFELFDSWEEKYQYIIELGQKLEKLDEQYKREENKIKGCQSSVWLHAYEKDGLVYFRADSDSTFVKGEIALLIMVLSGRAPDEIVNATLGFIDRIHLRQHMAQTRANGLAAMIKQMKLYALGYRQLKTWSTIYVLLQLCLNQQILNNLHLKAPGK